MLNADAGRSLVRLGLTGLGWNYTGAAIRALSQLAVGIVLARLLGPEPFGLIAIAWLVIGLGTLLADFGFASALVQRADLDERDIRYVFTLQMLLGAALTLGVWLAAPAIAAFFGRDDATGVLRAVGCAFLLQAAGQTAGGLLKRAMDFRGVQLAAVLSYLLGYCAIGLPLAALGWGVWSLVAAQLAQSGINSLLLWLQARHPIAPYFDGRGRRLARFGAKVVGGNVASWSITNLDNAFVGRGLGAVDLGLYSRTFGLLVMPSAALLSPLQSVLLSGYARSADRPEAQRRVYVASLGVVALLCAPMYLAAAVIPETLIVGLYGNAWLGGAGLVPPLALALLLNALLALSGPLLTANGHAGKEFAIQAIAAAAMVPAMALAASISIEAVAWAVSGVYALRCALALDAGVRAAHASWRSVLAVLAVPAAVGVLTAAAAYAADRAAGFADWPATARLLASMSAALVGLCGAVWSFRGALTTGTLGRCVAGLGDAMPHGVRRFFTPAMRDES